MLRDSSGGERNPEPIRPGDARPRAFEHSEVAIFAAADNEYVPTSVMALRSFQRWFPYCQYFLLGSRAKLTANSLALIERYRIGFLDVDLSERFVRHDRYKQAYPIETFYYLKGPELLANRGLKYSIGVDGDVFCARPFDLETVFRGIVGYGGRPVGTLRRTLQYAQRRSVRGGFGFAFERVSKELGIGDDLLDARYEVNAGVVFWKNHAMAKSELFESAIRVLAKCQGCIGEDQTLLTLTAAAHRIPFTELDESYNFFDNSFRPDPELGKRLKRGECQDVRIVHFVRTKPWRAPANPSAVKAYFINSWRSFVLRELGDEAYDLFDDLSMIRVAYPISPFWNWLRRIRSRLTD
jgi:hypothetical protein